MEPPGPPELATSCVESTPLCWAGGKATAGPRVVARERGARGAV